MADKIRGLEVKIGADTTDFNKALKQADSQLKTTDRTVEALRKKLDLRWDPTTFAKAQQLAQKEIQETDRKAEALRQRLKFLEDSGQADTQAYSDVQRAFAETELKADQLRQRLEQINKTKLDALEREAKKLGSAISDLGSAIMPASVAAAGMLAGVAAIGKSAVSAADNIQTMADQVNLSAEEMQRWQYIAMQTDVDLSSLTTALTKAQGGLAELATGGTSASAQALQRLGISSEQAAKGMSANFDTIIRRLSNVQDATEQAALANEIFGSKLGAKLIPMLRNGGKGLETLTEEFESLGYMTNETVARFADFDNVMNRIKYQFGMIKQELGAALIPLMQSLAGILQDRIIPMIRRAVDWFASLSDSQKKMILAITAVVAALGPLLVGIGRLVTAIGSISKATKALSSVLSALEEHPIVLVIVAIIALLVVMYQRNEEFRESVQRLFDVLMKSVGPVLNLVERLLERVLEALGGVISQLAESLVPIIDLVADILENVVAPILSTLMKILGPIVDLLVGIMVPVLQIVMTLIQPIIEVLSSILLPILSVIFGALSKICEFVLKTFQPVFEKMADFVRTIFAGLREFINDFLVWVTDICNWVIGVINGIIDGINKALGWTGVNLEHLGDVDLTIKNNGDGTATVSSTSTSAAETATQETGTSYDYSTTTYDYSDKDITVEVVVNNYGEKVDVDDLVTQINRKLAEAL